MKVLEQHPDGSQTVLYEPGDRVTFPKDVNGGGFLGAKAGQKATVIRRKHSEERFQEIAFLEVQTDEMKAGGWGVITVAPWDVELIPPDRVPVERDPDPDEWDPTYTE